ncbi:MAG: hypothetical protein IT160_07125 [Bryobacterales bacterium]|nr:hypothetical protein [Bryobacterales bacterium]
MGQLNRAAILLIASAAVIWAQYYGGSAQTTYLLFPAAVCQAGSAATGFSLPATDAPEAICSEGSNTLYGSLKFSADAQQQIQTHWQNPPDWTGAAKQIEIVARWATTATIGAVKWRAETTCAAAGATLDPAWQSVGVTTTGVPAQANAAVDSTIALTPAGCSRNSEFFLRFSRATDPPNNAEAAANLLWLRIKVTR